MDGSFSLETNNRFCLLSAAAFRDTDTMRGGLLETRFDTERERGNESTAGTRESEERPEISEGECRSVQVAKREAIKSDWCTNMSGSDGWPRITGPVSKPATAAEHRNVSVASRRSAWKPVLDLQLK